MTGGCAVSLMFMGVFGGFSLGAGLSRHFGPALGAVPWSAMGFGIAYAFVTWVLT